jgi:alpha-L-arabinofuranosidase
MSYGLGFYEYFLLAEDIGAIGVPVLNSGLYCQNIGNSVPIFDNSGEYTAEFQKYLDDMLDLVEFCRGDETTTWGKVRIEMGHEEPFALKYICIGNENWHEVYFERYSEFLKVFNKAKTENPELYDGIELIYSSGPDDADSGNHLYLPSYEYAKAELDKISSTDASDFAGATDHHYYNTPSWFLQHCDYYDEENYSRTAENMTSSPNCGGLKVFLGEYAAQSNTLKAALAEAAYMTGLERNGDMVVMAAYAPLFGNTTATHWAPDLIWFNNHSVTPSVNYYIQQLFAKNTGTESVEYSLIGAENKNTDLKGAVGVGTWYTSAKFDNVKITDNAKETLASDSFDSKASKKNWEFPVGGDWTFTDNALVYPTTDMSYAEVGTVAYFGDAEWSNYTYTVEATKLDGSEGFLIPFAVQGVDNNIFWNIGGWGNTVSALQQVENGRKTGQLPGTAKDFVVETGRTYELKVEVKGDTVKCYIDGELYVDYNFSLDKEYECYSVVSKDDNGDIIIKLVNVTDSSKTVAVNLDNADVASEATINQVAGNSLSDENVLDQDETCTMDEFTLKGFESSFNYTMPAYSVTAIRLKTK